SACRSRCRPCGCPRWWTCSWRAWGWGWWCRGPASWPWPATWAGRPAVAGGFAIAALPGWPLRRCCDRGAWRRRPRWLPCALAIATLVPAFAVAFLLRFGPPGFSPLLAACGVALSMFALGTVACTAMIYASLKPIPAWCHPLVLPVYLLFSLLTGLALLFMLMLVMLGDPGADMMLWTLAVVAVLLVALKWLYWHQTDRAPLPQTRGAAVGLPGRETTVFERPHTEANYVTREMAFQVARSHARWLRVAASVLVAGGPLLGWLLLGSAGPAAALAATALAMLAGAFVERWLFFAQARHLVTLYY